MARKHVAPAVTASKSAPSLSPDAAGAVRILAERCRLARAQLGALDFQRALLEAQAQPLRAQLQKDGAEADALIKAGADAHGITEAGWIYDPSSGTFSRKGQP